jgi:arylsulfatase I/J
MTPTRADNHPYRGGKYSDFEGGVRAAAFISGGFLPTDLHSKTYGGIIHICDWYTSLLTLAGATPPHIAADNGPGMPPLDSINIWPALTSNITSPRVVVPLSSAHGPPGWGPMSETGPCIEPGIFNNSNARCSQGAMIVGDWKLYYGPYRQTNWTCNFCWWTPARFPSQTTPAATSEPFTCDKGGCLFDLANDPQERADVAVGNPAKLAELQAAFASVQATVWWSRGGAEVLQPELCAAVLAHGNHVAPFNVSGACPGRDGCMPT